MISYRQVKKYCSESIENIENYKEAVLDSSTNWVCHHRREISENKSRPQLIKEGLYYKRPAAELIFLTSSDHRSLHNKGGHHSAETRRKISETKMGRKLSEEHRRKLSEAKKGNRYRAGKHLSAETRLKISETKKRHERTP